MRILEKRRNIPKVKFPTLKRKLDLGSAISQLVKLKLKAVAVGVCIRSLSISFFPLVQVKKAAKSE